MNNVVHLPATGRRHRPPRYRDHVDLRGRVPDGERITDPLVFGRDVWDLAGARQVGARNTRARFEKLPVRDRAWAKEWLLLVGAPQLAAEWQPDNRIAVRYATIERGKWRTAINQVDVLSRPLAAMADVPDDHPDYWHQTLDRWCRPIPKTDGRRGYPVPSPRKIADTVSLLRRVHDTFHDLGLGSPFPSRPWGDRHPDDVADRPSDPNRYVNKKRPHTDVFGWLGMCLRALDLCGDEIIARVHWWTRNGTPADASATTDRYEASHPDTIRPHFLPDGRDLRPNLRGLYWWSNRLVWAAYYGIAAMTSLRQEEMSLLEPDCVARGATGQHQLSGLLGKGFDIDHLQPETWVVNADVARLVGFINDLRDAFALPTAPHPKVPGRPMLFDQGLITATGKTLPRRPLDKPLLRSRQAAKFLTLGHALHRAGACPPVDQLEFHTHGVVRITCLEVHASGPLGDAVAVSVGKWRSFTTPSGYFGHVTKATSPPPASNTDSQALDLLPVLRVAAAQPEDLTGRSANRLAEQVAASPDLAAATITEKVLLKTARRAFAEVSVGPLCACMGPEGGLCGDGDHANHHLCALGCRNAVFTPYQRAHLELRRRYALLALGPLAPFAARVAEHEHSILSGEMDMSYDQLVDVLLAEWGTTDRELAALFYPLLAKAQP